ncbi:hypothetical protein WHT83_01685 [Aminobacter sp. P9b]|uniref:hypothetical protein n=1 Tax=Aminobacter sp. P9b TaxID=3133697 RepID=UPI003249F056
MSDSVAEAELLQRLIPELEGEGYEVFVQPNRKLVPSFMQGYQPDAIALRGDKNLAIEVISRGSPNSQRKLAQISEILKGQSRWDLRVLWIEDGRERKALPISSFETIHSRLDDARKIVAIGQPEAALLLAWASFEALARATLPDYFDRPQTPGRIVETLSAKGYFTPSEADKLRNFVRYRNAIIHGDIGQKIPGEEVSTFIDILETILPE